MPQIKFYTGYKYKAPVISEKRKSLETTMAVNHSSLTSNCQLYDNSIFRNLNCNPVNGFRGTGYTKIRNFHS